MSICSSARRRDYSPRRESENPTLASMAARPIGKPDG
jgi:hypothetical protein